MLMPKSEVADKLSISLLKLLHGYEGARGEIIEYFLDLYPGCISVNLLTLFQINSTIWDLESDIRLGNVGDMTLEQIGIRSLKIRDLNRMRIKIKNRISKLTRSGYQEKKIQHVSEER